MPKLDHTVAPSLFIAGLALFQLASCAHSTIPNTYVEDTKENREVLEFVEKYRRAVETRDMGLLLTMASQSYFDDMGTPRGDDDIDYETLREGLVRLREEVTATRYQISYRAVTYVSNRALVDILYTGWFRVNTPEGPQWRRRLEPHRLVLQREGSQYKILSGM